MNVTVLKKVEVEVTEEAIQKFRSSALRESGQIGFFSSDERIASLIAFEVANEKIKKSIDVSVEIIVHSIDNRELKITISKDEWR